MTCEAKPVRLDPLHSLSKSLKPLSGELKPETLATSDCPGLGVDLEFNLNILFRFAWMGPWGPWPPLPSTDKLPDDAEPVDRPDLPR